MRKQRTAAIHMIAILLVLGLGAVGFASSANAQTYPSVATLTIDRPQTTTCGIAVVTGTGFLPNTTVTLTIGGQVIGTAQTDASGNFTFQWTVPSNWPIGPVTIQASDGTNTLTVNTNVTACATTSTTSNNNSGINSNNNASSGSNAGSGSTGTTGSLASTGSANTVLFVRIAVLLLAAGGILLLAVNRRQRRSGLA